MDDYYKILKVSRAATTGQLRKAISDRRSEIAKSKSVEPSLLPLLDEAERVLLDPSRRIGYDLDLRRSGSSLPAERNSKPEPPAPQPLVPKPPAPPPQSLNPPRGQICRICGARIPEQAIFCPSCDSPTRDNNPQPQSPQEQPLPPVPVSPLEGPPRRTNSNRSSLLFGARVQGIVVSVEAYEVKKSKVVSWIFKILLLAAIIAYVIYKLLSIFIVVAIVAIILIIFTRFGSFLVQLLMLPFSLFSKVSLPSMGDKTVRVTNVRLNLEDRSEVQVRIDGQLTVGSITPGDEVLILGRFWGGALRFSKGKNLRTGSLLRKEWLT